MVIARCSMVVARRSLVTRWAPVIVLGWQRRPRRTSPVCRPKLCVSTSRGRCMCRSRTSTARWLRVAVRGRSCTLSPSRRKPVPLHSLTVCCLLRRPIGGWDNITINPCSRVARGSSGIASRRVTTTRGMRGCWSSRNWRSTTWWCWLRGGCWGSWLRCWGLRRWRSLWGCGGVRGTRGPVTNMRGRGGGC